MNAYQIFATAAEDSTMVIGSVNNGRICRKPMRQIVFHMDNGYMQEMTDEGDGNGVIRIELVVSQIQWQFQRL